MPTYRVIGARIADGADVDEQLTADSEAEARRSLSEQGVAVSELRPVAAAAADQRPRPAAGAPPTDPAQARVLADVAASLATLASAADDLRKHTRAIRRQTTIVHLATAIVVGSIGLVVVLMVLSAAR